MTRTAPGLGPQARRPGGAHGYSGAMAGSHENLVRLAVQHARTAQLLGAEFIPRYRSARSALGEPANHGAVAPERAVVAPTRDHRTRARDGGAIQARLDALRARYEADAPHARFNTPFTKIVFGEGDPAARLVFVGEAPGEDEDLSGRPFVGRAGQLLEKMIIGMGLSRQQVYICNVLKTRPPGNSPPTPDEVVASAPYLYEQIATIGPEVIVTLGRPATHLLLRSEVAIGRLRGQWAEFAMPAAPDGFDWPEEWSGLRFGVMPTYHPAYLLRSYTDENRKAVWSDLKQVLDRLGLKPPARGGNHAG